MNIIKKIDLFGTSSEESIVHVSNDSKMTYNDLKVKSDALACYLIDRFEDDKTPIVVYGHKQHEMLICFLACVKAGHAYIPVDSSFPLERVKAIAEGSGTKLLLNIENTSLDFDFTSIMILDDIYHALKDNIGRIPDESYYVDGDDTYYIIYTSGSTGNPKGVQISEACLESFVAWGTSLCNENLSKDTVFMNQAPFSFDLSVMDLYLSLSNGCTLFSVDKASIANMKQLFEGFSNSSISIWVSTPSFAEMCLADSNFNSDLLPNLKLFLFCGEVLSNNCVSKLKERFDGCTVINTYGPTEATVAVTSVPVTDEINAISPLPVGKVKSDCEILILDEEGKEVPEGGKGEIVIVGDSVSTGYYKNKAITDKVFGVREINGEVKRAYKTGDEGYLKDGMLYYSGRIDFQVKLNGYRIELEDIENNLRKVSLIKNVVVIPMLKDGKIQYLSAVAVLNKKSEKRDFEVVMEIKNELKKFIPEYMIPRKITFREALPMTVNGKVNRKLLTEEMA